MSAKQELGRFLAHNPFAKPLTLGFFYREKMRAIHRIAPRGPIGTVLEVGGGQSGLTSLLYPGSRVITLDLDPSYGRSPANQRPPVRFVAGDATWLPFRSAAFDLVTLFDVVEHVSDDGRVIREALRVLRPGGSLMISSPNERWRFPYHAWMRRLCPSEATMMQAWGHVRRGYELSALERLVGFRCGASATFIGPVTVVSHDISFSRLPSPVRRLLCAALSPVTWTAYALHRPDSPGTETAAIWTKP